jgi:uncharacterized surface anchored protein
VNVSNCASVAIHKQDDAGTALSGAGFTLYTNLAPLTGPRQITDLATPLTCSTLSAGDCTISDVPYGDYWVVETTTPANHDTAADQAINVASSGNTPSGTLTFVDPRLQGSIIVSKTDAFSNPLAGAGFTVNPGSHVMTEGATGVFCVDGLTYGGYTITESTVPFGYTGGSDQTFSVSTKSTCAARLAAAYTPDKTFVNSSKPGTINVLKTDDAAIGNPIAGAGFTLYQDIDAVGTYQPLVDTTKQAGPTSTSAEGVLQFGSVPIGDYCVVETFTPTGYATAPAQCVTIHLATDGETLNLTFVDPRQHKVIVIVCHEGTNTLDSSPVTLGTTKSSLASPPLGITEAQLCALGGASFGGLSHGSSVPSVSVQ